MIIKRTGHAGRHHFARCLLVGAIGATLVGCGGSSGDGDGGFQDANNDGIADADIDGDGVIDDLNGDGFPDVDTDGDGQVDDLNADGVPDYFGDSDGDGNNDLDTDGDGVPDDFDGDGVADRIEGDEDGDGFVDPSAENPCGGTGGSDPDSSNNSWDDNCTVERFGQFEDSLYTAGIQRVVYCDGFGEADSVDDFADGDGGPATFGAVEDYQRENELTVDGIVGPSTWGSLQDKLVLVDPAPLSGGYDGYTVEGLRCGGEVLFYQEVGAAASVTETPERFGWELASSAGSTTRVPFNIEVTNGRLD